MENIWALVAAILLFLLFAFLFWRLIGMDAKKEYGAKMWNHWPTRLSFFQALVFYSSGFTIITMLLLKWGNVLTF